MSDARTCPNCGGPMPDDLLDGLCPRCVVRVAIAAPDEDIGASLTEEASGESTRPLTSPAVDVADHQPGDRIGRYKLLETIGEGAFGVVYTAEQEEPVRRVVALKIIKLGMDTKEVIARFEAERQALALMDHPNIAKVFDGGATETGRPYFVMDLVKGIPLIRFCDEQRLCVQERLELFIQVCQAIQHAHQKGIIHRDLKPSNVLVALYDGRPVPKVIDFGVAKAMGQRLTERTLYTQFGAVVGTLEYMSPEQAELSQVDINTRSDIYSLGVLLYELLTGTTPLSQEELCQGAFAEVLRRVCDKEPLKPSLRLSTSQEQLPTISAQRKLEPEKLTKLVRGELDWIVMKALEKDRTRRYETAGGLALDLQRYLNNEPVVAGPPTVRYRLKKFVGKHRTRVVIAAGFLLLLAGAAAVSLAGVVLVLTAAVVVSLALALWAIRERGNALRAEVAAKEARTVAEREAKSRLEALTDMQVQRAQDLFAADDTARAVAQLANVLSRDSSNGVAASRRLSALTFRNFNLPLTKPLRHDDQVNSAQFSPDGRWVVTASWDQTARVWDAQSCQPVTEPLRHELPVLSAQFSPDGLMVVTVCDALMGACKNYAQVWDARTGKPLTEPLRHDGPVNSAQFSPDGLRGATGSEDQTARVWDAQTGQPLTEPLRHEGSVNFAQCCPDGRWVVTGSADFTARIWEIPCCAAGPTPPWLPTLAETIAFKRLNPVAIFEQVAPGEYLRLKEQLLKSTETNYYARWAKWFCSDRSTRTISPLSSITVPEYVQRRIQENTLESLQEAVRLAPTNGLAHARLAKQVMAQSDEDNPRRLGEADFFSPYALKWSPHDAEVTTIRAEIVDGKVKSENMHENKSE